MSGEVIQPAPLPYSVQVAKVGDATIENGDTVALLSIAILTPAGQTVIFATAPDALGIADLIREQASGLTIAQTLDGRAVT